MCRRCRPVGHFLQPGVEFGLPLVPYFRRRECQHGLLQSLATAALRLASRVFSPFARRFRHAKMMCVLDSPALPAALAARSKHHLNYDGKVEEENIGGITSSYVYSVVALKLTNHVLLQ